MASDAESILPVAMQYAAAEPDRQLQGEMQMAVDPDVIMGKSDKELMFWVLSGEGGSSDHLLAESALKLRVAVSMLEASREQTNATKKWLEANLQLDETTRKLVVQTQSLAKATRGIVLATWGVVIITLATQIALIYLTAAHK